MNNEVPLRRAEVIGKFLVIQQSLDGLPNETRIAEFTAQALATVPGVDTVLSHVCDLMLAPDAKIEETRAACIRLGYPQFAGDPARRVDEPGLHFLPLSRLSNLFGFLLVRAANEDALRPYVALLSNVANAVSNVLDTRLQHHLLSRTTEQLLTRSKELQASNDQLEVEVREREHAQAEQAALSRDLKRSNAELEQFAYVASHDLQEPLRMVVSYLQLLDKKYQGQLDGDAHEYIAFAVDGAMRMQALINDLLTYSRVGSTAAPLQPTDSAAVVETALQSLRVAIEDSHAVIRCGELPIVMGDAAQLTQLFQNLIGNAIKFRGGRTPAIAVSAKADESFWRFSIQDNGIGISAEYFDRIFVMFQRLHSRGAYEGTGIGLAICKKIVERHGGRIWVESEPGQGSVFNFTLQQAGGHHA